MILAAVRGGSNSACVYASGQSPPKLAEKAETAALDKLAAFASARRNCWRSVARACVISS